jgi:hypothetical protein
MTLHHQKHHQAYVNGLNNAEQSLFSAATPREKIALQAAYKFNGGGQPPVLVGFGCSDARYQVTSTTPFSGRIWLLLHTVLSTLLAVEESSSQVLSRTRSTATLVPWTK